ncbi:MAG: DUF4166 domain-containing protein [Rhizobiaceae bacterium]
MRERNCPGIPLPMAMALAPRSRAREWQEGRRFRFDVPIALPLVGPIVSYTGWLTPDTVPELKWKTRHGNHARWR